MQNDEKDQRLRRRRRQKISGAHEIAMRVSCLGASVLVIFLPCSSIFTTTGVSSAFVPVPQPPRHSHFSTPLSVAPSHPVSLLEDLTVKELRQLLKDHKLHEQERGLLSRLKRKHDLVDYLAEHLPFNESSSGGSTNRVLLQPEVKEEPTEVASDTPAGSQQTSRRSTAPLRMPPLTTVPSTRTNGELTPKDVLYEQLYRRYPPLRPTVVEEGAVLTSTQAGVDDVVMDVRQQYHPMLQNTTKSDMDVIFIGTASCTPGATRGVSCTALRLNWRRRSQQQAQNNAPQYSSFSGGTWLFDVGECTQLQVQRTSGVKPGKITKIFITHAHGDHSFGLPGLLCLMGQDRDRDAPPVEIYGPEGLRTWLRVAIRYSVSRIVPPYRVHEIMDIPMAPEWELHRRTNRYFYRGRKQKQQQQRWGSQGLAGEDRDSWITQCNHVNLPPSPQFGEIPGGRDIFPNYGHPSSYDGAPVWEVEDEDDVKVYAAPMSHGVPCLGYVVDEQTRPGRLRNEYVEPIVKRNLGALREAGFTIPMKAMAVIKNLPEGSSFSFPDGTVVTHAEAVDPPRNGRKVVICGDTADARALTNLAQDADVLVHEATNTYLPGVDKDSSLRAVTKDTVIHGHSTPFMAGEFAKKVKAKRLLLNHFSARYKGDEAIDSISLMTRIEMQAIKASSLDETNIAAAWDLMMLPVLQK